jgi:hypothetical protein
MRARQPPQLYSEDGWRRGGDVRDEASNAFGQVRSWTREVLSRKPRVRHREFVAEVRPGKPHSFAEIRSRGAGCVFPKPFPVHIKARAAPLRSAAAAIRVFGIRNVTKPSFWIARFVRPLLVFDVAVSERKTIATTMVISRNIRVARSCQIALQITVLESVHALVAKNPNVGHTNATEVTHLLKQPPTFNHTGHRLLQIRGHAKQVTDERGIHGDATDSNTVVRGDRIARAPVNLDVANIRPEAVGSVGVNVDIPRRRRPVYLAIGTPANGLSVRHCSHRTIWNQEILPIIAVHCTSNSDLLLVAKAMRALRFGLRLGERRQEHSRQDRDNCNDHQQFN